MQAISRRHILGGAAAMALGAGSARTLLAQAPGAPAASADAPKFQLGTVTYNVSKDYDLPTLLKVCKNAGIAAIELRTTHKHGVEPTLSKTDRTDVKKRFADSGVVCWGTGSVCEFHAAAAAVVQKNIETCKQFIELTADIGGRGVKVRPNGFPKGVPEEKTLEQIGKALIECGKAAESAGIEICVEVHGAGTSHPPHMKTVMEHCGHKSVGLTWNSNATDVKDGSVAEYFAMLRPWIKSCHINDLSKGAGGYPYRELFKLFRETGYDRYTMCEVATGFADPGAGEKFYKHYKALWTMLATA